MKGDVMVEFSPYWVVSSAHGRVPAADLGEARLVMSGQLSDLGARLSAEADDWARTARLLSGADTARVFAREAATNQAATLSDRAEAAFGLARAAAHAEPGSAFVTADVTGALARYVVEEGEAPPEETPTVLWAATGVDADGGPLTLIFSAPDDHEAAVQAAFDHEVFGPPEYYTSPRDFEGEPPTLTQVARLTEHVIVSGDVDTDRAGWLRAASW